MPELPEVETVCRAIEPSIVGRSIDNVKVFQKSLRIEIPKNFSKELKDKFISRVKRKAKYICIYVKDSSSEEEKFLVVVHLGMSGRLMIHPEAKSKRLKHDHVIFNLDNGSQMVLNDPRRFGLITLLEKDKMDDFKFFKKLGLEPLSKDFNKDVLYQILSKRKKSIKSTLMDSSLIAGVGNIYACEVLFEAKLHPEKLASELSKDNAADIYKAIVKILKAAIKAGGSTIKDYTSADGNFGYFQHKFAVYGKDGQDCICGEKIIRIKQNNRSSFLCPSCQK